MLPRPTVSVVYEFFTNDETEVRKCTFSQFNSGGRIRKLRREHHLTQERLAVMLNISVEHLRKIELGKRGISIDLLLDLSNVLEASLDFLLKGQPLTAVQIKELTAQIHKTLEQIDRLSEKRG